MLDREDVAARLAAAVLQSAPEPPGQRPGQAPDMIATRRYAVAVYETILGMLPQTQPAAGPTASRRAASGQPASNNPALPRR